MMNEMPIEYEIPIDDPYEVFEEPILITALDVPEYRDLIKPINIYCVTYQFPADTVLPIISEKTKDTLVMVLESLNFDSWVDASNASAVYLYGYTILTALEMIPGTKFRVFGQIRYKPNDFILKEFIED